MSTGNITQNTIVHKADTRGHAKHGWLDSHHTFSFAGYYNEERMNFGMLRVLNDDIVAPGMGFGKHPHSNMEIISIPLKGALEHSDSTGQTKIIRTGDVQIMSAGTGVYHSEYNHSGTDPVNFLQIWVFPKEKNIEPRYEQKTFKTEERLDCFQTVVSPEDSDGALWINQEAWFSMSRLSPESSNHYKLHKEGNGVYLFILEGSVVVDGVELNRRDGIGITGKNIVNVKAAKESEILVMEVPIQ